MSRECSFVGTKHQRWAGAQLGLVLLVIAFLLFAIHGGGRGPYVGKAPPLIDKEEGGLLMGKDVVLLLPEHVGIEENAEGIDRVQTATLVTLSHGALAAIQGQCELVRRTVLGTWLPMARRDPRTGRRLLHVAFLGDSMACLQFRYTVNDVDVCLTGMWRQAPVTHNYNLYPAPPTAEAVFEFEGVQGLPPSPEDTEGHVTLAITYVKNRYSVEMMRTLDRVYKASATNVEWPFFPQYPSPQILYAATGAWDLTAPVEEWDGFTHIGHDWFRPAKGYPMWPEVLDTFETWLAHNFTRPMQSLLRAWQQRQPLWGPQDSLRGLHPGLTPPEHFTLLAPSRTDCSAEKYEPRRQVSVWKADIYYNLLGMARCTALVLPAMNIVNRSLLSAAEAAARASAGPSPPPGTFVHAQNGAEDVNMCHRYDGVHFSDWELPCRDYLVKTFWSAY